MWELFLPQLAGRLHRAQHFYRKYLVMLFCLPKSLYMLPLGIFSLRSVNTSTFLFPLPKLLWTWVISKARSNFFYKITQKINLLVFNCTYWAKNMCYHHTKCKDKCFSLIKLSLPWTSFTWKNIVLCISAIYSDIMWVREVRSDHHGARFCHQSPRILQKISKSWLQLSLTSILQSMIVHINIEVLRSRATSKSKSG